MTIITSVGRITRDLELKTIEESGLLYVNFGLAVDEGYGEKKKTIFYDCTIYGPEAEWIIKAKAKKGSVIQVSGKFWVSEYPRKNGEGTGYSLKIKVLAWSYIPGASSNTNNNVGKTEGVQNNGNENGAAIPPVPEFPPNDYAPLNLDDDELPF